MKIWNSPAGNFKLERYPYKGDPSHQAWDAADDWIVRHIPSQDKPALIIGEAFGALAVAWNAGDIYAAGDSFMAHQALRLNRKLNDLPGQERLNIVPTTEPPAESFDRIFLRLPKSLNLLDYYIRYALKAAAEGAEIWVGGMDKRWSPGVKKLTDRLLEISEVFKFEKRARWIRFRAPENQPPTASERPGWELHEWNLKFRAAPDVFSSSTLDEGTKAFISAFPKRETEAAGMIADIGCGSGILGFCAARINGDAEYLFTDESYLAVANAEENYRLNGLAAEARFIADNGLESIGANSVDLVLLNPPFHFQNIQSREPADFMFSEAYRCLKPGGCLQIVGNTHLGYHRLLEDWFDRQKTVYKSRKFTVLRAVKRR